MSTDVVVALDIGGTAIKCATVRLDGTVRTAHSHPTGAGRGPDAVLATVLGLAEETVAAARADGLAPRGVGVAAPGFVDEATGVAVWSANVGFRDVPLRDLLGNRTGLPSVVGHDVRCGGLAEARLGAGRGAGQSLFVAVGTGIAAAQVIDGRPVAGAHGAAGELGHLVVRPGGPPCACGGRGCLEAVASAAAISRHFTELSGRPASAAEVAARAAAGEPAAVRVWREAVDALADGLVIAQTICDAAVIVVGGGLSRAGPALLDPLRAAVLDRITVQRPPRIAGAALGDRAGCVGAALLAIDHLRGQPAR